MNILFIGQFKINSDGWTEHAKDLARSLLTQDCNLVLRNINMANRPPDKIDDDLVPFLNKKLSHYDVVIQKVLPNLLTYNNQFKQNITIQLFETELPKTHTWLNKFNLVDKILISSNEEKRWLSKYYKKSVYQIGGAIDISIANQQYQPLHPIFNNNVFKFYCINSNLERKNLDTLVRAYFTAFTINDNVVLVIKSSDISQDIEKIKDSLRLHFNKSKYPPIVLISNHLNNQQLNSIHAYCDCFVSPSKGEAFSRNAATALVFGNPIIATDKIGITDYIDDSTGWLVDSKMTNVKCFNPPMSDIYRGNEQWFEPDFEDLILCMKEAYLDKTKFKLKKENIQLLNIKNQFSYTNVGKSIMDAINS